MDPLFLSRLALLAYIGALVAVALRRRACVRAYFFHAGSPLDLAIARVVVFAVIAAAVDVTETAAIADLPHALIEPPLGVGWVVGWLPLGGAGLAALGWVVRISATLAALGAATAVTAPAATLAACAFFAIPHLFGHVAHTHHHLIWFAGLLAVSRCADRMSLDAVLRHRRRRHRGLAPLAPAPAIAYGFPLRSMLFVLAISYFFAGFWKLWTNGILWFTSDNLTLLAIKLAWAHHVPVPALLELAPRLGSLGALSAVFFELGFLLAIFFPRARLAALVAGVLFHVAIRYFTGIAFTQLVLCYPIFVEWSAWIEPAAAPRSNAVRPSTPLLALAAILIGASAALGALRVSDAWPLSAYPRFDVVHTARMTSFIITGYRAGGESVDVRDADLGDPRLRGRMLNLFRFNQDRAPDVEETDGRENRWRVLCTTVWRRNPALRDAVRAEFALVDVDLSGGVERPRVLGRRVVFECER